MPRPRSIDDAVILDATRLVMGRVGPGKFTLALVAEEVGLAPATLIQRFGSKRGLLVSLAGSAQVDAAQVVEQLLKKHASPVQALREYLLCFANMASTPEEMANHLAFFQMDLTDPDLRRITVSCGFAREYLEAECHVEFGGNLA